MEKYWYLIIGIAIGWITKIPFLMKWYKELKNHKRLVRNLFKDKSVDVGLLRDCWSVAIASGHNNWPSLSKMQKDFEDWMDEHKIIWRKEE